MGRAENMSTCILRSPEDSEMLYKNIDISSSNCKHIYIVDGSACITGISV